jgi:hypothetical protein
MSKNPSWHRWMTVGMTAVALGSGSGQAWAEADEKLPFFMAVQQTLLRDSNFSRTDEPVPETVSSTAGVLGLDKYYGRQHYSLKTQLAANRYANLKELLNNDSKLLNGKFSTELLANWKFTLGGNLSQNLNPIKDNINSDRVVRNIRTYKDHNASLQYGLSGDWSISGNVDSNTVRYSQDAYAYNNANQHSHGVKLNYFQTNELVYGLGYRKVATHYVDRSDDRTVTDHNIDLSANWQVTGLSNLSTQLTRRRSSYSDDPLQSNKAWSGNLGVAFTPRGIWTYRLNASRYSGADRVDTVFTDNASASGRTDTVTSSTNYQASASAALTSKIQVSGSYLLNKNRYNYNALYTNVNSLYCLFYGFCDAQSNIRSLQRTITLSMSYQPMRSLQGECNVQAYSQTRDQYLRQYEGRSVDCTLTFTLE